MTTGNEKTSCTVALAFSSNRLKLSPIVIFKRKTLPKEIFSDRDVEKANKKGCMDEGLMRAWISEVFSKRSGGSSTHYPQCLSAIQCVPILPKL